LSFDLTQIKILLHGSSDKFSMDEDSLLYFYYEEIVLYFSIHVLKTNLL